MKAVIQLYDCLFMPANTIQYGMLYKPLYNRYNSGMPKKYSITETDKVLAVVELASISKAAKKLGISQSSLSRTIQEFEKEMSAQLFTRTGGGVVLTEAGQICADHLWQMKKAEEDMYKSLEYLGSSKQHLDVALPMDINRSDAVKIEQRIQELYPDVHIRIIHVLYRDVMQGILSGKFDFAVCWNEVADDQRFSYEEFYEDRLLLLVPNNIKINNYRMTDGSREYGTVETKDLNGIDFVIQNEGTSIRRVIDQIFTDNQISVNIKMSVSNSVLAIRAVEEGIGSALVIESQSSWLFDDPSFSVYVLNTDLGETIGLLRLAKKELSPLEEYAAQVIRECLSERNQPKTREKVTE